ncbi:low-specificity L-threonine aldolase [Thalassobacillus sp. CUG 92003]|uniref:low-specificity L-threonine aldolase n=1 Tax=Thalassobacillus sp. CUG 92003 TaxID=2736641 RepID=UPI0015E77878
MIDLRSDTVTKPTEAMRQAAYDAEVGDDVYEEDPTIHQLEHKAAELLGKEDALFVTSGTQGNQIAVLTHCNRGDEAIMEANSHIFMYEAASVSALAGVQPRTLNGTRGAMDPSDVAAAIRPHDIHFPETGLICLENTHNRAGGALLPIENMKTIYQIASEHHIPIHLDGARLFNASISSGFPVQKYAELTDTVQVCLSKGLGAPVGSVIAGSEAFIARARKWRKRLGGGLRQAGVLAAPGLVALTDMVNRLAEDQKHAEILARELGKIDGVEIENEVETNIVLVNVKNLGYTSEQFLTMLKENDILAAPFGPHTVRFVTHYGISRMNINSVIEHVAAVPQTQ